LVTHPGPASALFRVTQHSSPTDSCGFTLPTINQSTLRQPCLASCSTPHQLTAEVLHCLQSTTTTNTFGHSCHVQGLWSVGETLPCRTRRHGTASLLNYGL